MRALLDKDPVIVRTLDRLWTRLGPDAFDVVDHWEDDPIAVGIASPRNHGMLAYLAAYDDGFHVELETPPVPGDDFPYQVAGRHSDLNFEQLVDVVRKHLARA